VAERVKRRRAALGLTVRALAARSGVSSSMISDIERAAKSPTIAVLAALAKGLDVQLVTLIAPGDAPPKGLRIRRARASAPIVGRQAGVRGEILSPPFPGTGIRFMRYIVPAGRQAGPFPGHPAGTIEHIHVARGEIRVVLGARSAVLKAGDSCSCAADSPHVFDNSANSTDATFYLVTEKAAGVRPRTR
jgi:transcriptional regulator with XRE-family HTH domain